MSKKIHRQRNDEQYELKNEIMLYRKMQTASFQPRLFSHLIHLKEQRFKELIEYDWHDAMIRSRVQEIEEGENPTRLMSNRNTSSDKSVESGDEAVEAGSHLPKPETDYIDVIMGAIASQITSITIVYSIVNSDADHRKHQSSASLAFVRGNHRGPVNSPYKWPVTRKTFPFDDVTMKYHKHVITIWPATLARYGMRAKCPTYRILN